MFDIKLATIGLGCVGLPLAVEFGKQRPVVGFDINPKRIDQLKAGHDATLETERSELQAATHLSLSTELDDLRACNCYIVTVPTPIDIHKRPDLRNTRVVDIVKELSDYNVQADAFDPWANAADAQHEYGINLMLYDLKYLLPLVDSDIRL